MILKAYLKSWIVSLDCITASSISHHWFKDLDCRWKKIAKGMCPRQIHKDWLEVLISWQTRLPSHQFAIKVYCPLCCILRKWIKIIPVSIRHKHTIIHTFRTPLHPHPLINLWLCYFRENGKRKYKWENKYLVTSPSSCHFKIKWFYVKAVNTFW